MKLKRTIYCGKVRSSDLGQTITVNGWVDGIREMGGLVFIDLRDREGLVQLVFDQDNVPELHTQAKRMGREFVIGARGEVALRGEGRVNPDLSTGEIEVLVSELEIFNRAETPPIEVRDDVEFDPELRLRYRYIDLRRPRMQEIFRLRSEVTRLAREYFCGQGFREIETPLLTRPTPEGARDFLVPARQHPGRFYSLPQSPQIFKQILMTSGFDRYFQIARCLRDEAKRADRQIEHTQIDLEMSFVEPIDVQTAVEGMITQVMKEALGVEVALPLSHMSHDQAMKDYGSDRPDRRYGMELVDISGLVAESGFGVFKDTVASGKVVMALCIPGGHEKVSKGQFKKLEKDAKGKGAKGLAFIRFTPEGPDSPIVKFFGEGELDSIRGATGAKDGDLLLFVADTKQVAGLILGQLRSEFGRKLGLISENECRYLWIDNFPQFEYDEESNTIIPAHHPFVAPVEEDAIIALAEELKRTDGKATPKVVDLALSIKATQYDLVLNGVELGSGSIRITRLDVQDAVFTCLGMSREEAEFKFGFLLETMKYGAPPMAGIGIGLDRWLMAMLNIENIQDVIVFPKTATGKGLLDGCPAEADAAQLEELHLRVES